MAASHVRSSFQADYEWLQFTKEKLTSSSIFTHEFIALEVDTALCFALIVLHVYQCLEPYFSCNKFHISGCSML